MRQSREPYRGYSIAVEVKTTSSISFTGIQRRYTALWIIYSNDSQLAPVASFPEKVDFESEDAALRYGQKRARAFVDGMGCHS
ncbi:hypothetical protein [Paraburkholderia phenoliruptrix]|uniref:hypothetical protein n=1 Tax=Paraburkholderia phenoliruptrix TaxID=252970 RepID=UPI002869C67C|nr:hypothetical protein [Paraburkholderia phenoliruptrix]WMY11059.1 hypothetical protein P3F88_30840 [Paraburkholderia phenoliruptrix]